MILGLDIGRHTIKLVSVEKTKEGFKILDAASRLVPDANRAYDPEKIDKPMWIMAIKELMRLQGINPKRVKNIVTGIGGVHASVKQITTLDMPTEELHSSMTLEARKHIPMDGTDAVIDFEIFGPNAREVDKIDVGLVACTKGILNHHLDLLKECGFKPGIVDVEPIAMTNTFSHAKDMPEDGLVVLLDIGAVSSGLVVWGHQQQYFTRDIQIGGHDFVKAVMDKKDLSYIDAQDLLQKEGLSAILSQSTSDHENAIGLAERTVFDNLVEDIRRSLRFYAKTTGQSFFLKILLSGGVAETPGLVDYIQSKLNVDTAIINPLESLAGIEELEVSNPSQYAIALGLAIRGGLS
ncbi:MAG: type IV pilus assembly protein PilM [Candidatus Marinimicrobia bacterium]|nr:type IV pilus assembly protein PilM [Candidatus Neomarinimicrobiota bacterium]